MKTLAQLAALTAVLFVCASCSKAPEPERAGHDHAEHDHDHDHGDHAGHDHDHDDHEGHDHGDHDGHDHEEVPLGSFAIGDLQINAAQGHGAVEAGKENHLVVKLPYNDKGGSIVRAWIGGADRTLSTVGKGAYEADHGDYLIHAVAPSPLPADAQWWVEIEKPDGTKAVGSFAFK